MSTDAGTHARSQPDTAHKAQSIAARSVGHSVVNLSQLLANELGQLLALRLKTGSLAAEWSRLRRLADKVAGVQDDVDVLALAGLLASHQDEICTIIRRHGEAVLADAEP